MIVRDANALTPNPFAAPSSPENEEDIAEEAANNLCLDCMGPLGRDRYNDVKREVLSAIKRARQQPAQKPQEAFRLCDCPEWDAILSAWSDVQEKLGCPNCSELNVGEWCPACDEVQTKMGEKIAWLGQQRILLNASTQTPCAEDLR